MKILIPIKKVLDPAVHVRVKSDESGVDITNEKMSINPFDEIAIEAALQLKESDATSELIAVTCGADDAVSVLYSAMAMGVDRSIHISTDMELQPLAIAKLLARVCITENPSLVICGKQAIDDDASQVPQMLAGLTGWSQAMFVTEIENKSENELLVTTEIDGGLENLKITLPAVISTDLRLNTPRYITLMNIMKAKKKQLDVISSDSLSVDVEPRLQTLKVVPAPDEREGEIVNNVDELIIKLKERTRMI